MADNKVTLELDASGDMKKEVEQISTQMKRLEQLTVEVTQKFKMMGEVHGQFQSLSKSVTAVSQSFEKSAQSMPKAMRAVGDEVNRAVMKTNALTVGGPSSRVFSGVETFGRRLSSVSGRMSLFSIPLGLFGHEMLQTAAGFERMMNKANHLIGEGTIDSLRQRSLELSRQSKFNATEIGEAIARLGAAGIKTGTILGTLPKNLKFAEAGELDLGAATDFALSVMNQFGFKVSEMPRVLDDIAWITDETSAEISGMAESFVYAGGQAAIAKVPFHELLAELGALAGAGLTRTIAGTSLGMAYSRLLKPPADEVMKIYRKLGITKSDILTAKGEMKSFVGFIELLKKKKATPGDILKIFEEEAGKAVLSLMTRGTGMVRDYMAGLSNTTGAVEKKAAALSMGAAGAMDRLKNSVHELQIAMGSSGVLDDYAELTRRVTAMTQRLSQTNPELLKTITLAGGVSTAMGPVLFGLSQALIIGAVAGKSLGAVARFTKIPTPIATGIAYGTWWLSSNFKEIVRRNIDFYRGQGDKVGLKLFNPAFDPEFFDYDKQRKEHVVSKGINPDLLRPGEWDYRKREFRFIPDALRDLINVSKDVGAFPVPDDKTPRSHDAAPLIRSDEKTGKPPFSTSSFFDESPARIAAHSGEVRVHVDFKNLPRGVAVTTENPGRVPLSFDLGYAMEEAS